MKHAFTRYRFPPPPVVGASGDAWHFDENGLPATGLHERRGSHLYFVNEFATVCVWAVCDAIEYYYDWTRSDVW